MAQARQTDTAVWIPFRMHRRNLEWQVAGDSPRYLHIRSLDGKLSIRAKVVSEYTRFKWETNETFTFRYSWEGDPMSVIKDVEVLGVEFPLGCEYTKAGFVVGGSGHMFVRYGIIHTELVRACLEQWSNRRRFRDKKKPQPDNPNSN